MRSARCWPWARAGPGPRRWPWSRVGRRRWMRPRSWTTSPRSSSGSTSRTAAAPAGGRGLEPQTGGEDELRRVRDDELDLSEGTDVPFLGADPGQEVQAEVRVAGSAVGLLDEDGGSAARPHGERRVHLQVVVHVAVDREEVAVVHEDVFEIGVRHPAAPLADVPQHAGAQ